MKKISPSITWNLVALMMLCMLAGGCATNPQNRDPFEKSNRAIYQFNDSVDRHIAKPVADAYSSVVPQTVRVHLENAFVNAASINTILNGFLQGKTSQGFSDLGRLGVNTTVGILGLFDPATGMGMKKHEADFGQTLGVWGVGSGPYLVLPLLGPSTVRDTTSIPVAIVTHPLFYVDDPAIWIPIAAVGAVNARAQATDAILFRDRAAIEPYTFTREAYLKYRDNKVRKGPAPTPDIDELDTEEATTKPATRPSSAK